MKTMLVVIDMQNDFVSGALGTPEARQIVPRVIQKIRSADMVCFTSDTHGLNYLNTLEGKHLPIPHCVYGTPGHALIPEIQELVAHPNTFYKVTFGSKSLAEQVKLLCEKQKISEVVLVGVCTDICVVSNALLIKAFCPELPISVDAACCAGTTPEMHRKALDVMRSCQVNIIGEGNNID